MLAILFRSPYYCKANAAKK